MTETPTRSGVSAADVARAAAVITSMREQFAQLGRDAQLSSAVMQELLAATADYIITTHAFFAATHCSRCQNDLLGLGSWLDTYWVDVCDACNYIHIRAIPSELRGSVKPKD